MTEEQMRQAEETYVVIDEQTRAQNQEESKGQSNQANAEEEKKAERESVDDEPT